MSGGFAKDFGDFDGRVWLNTAHQGALPRVAAEAAFEAIAWKTSPRHLIFERFAGVPDRLRSATGALLNVPPSQVVLSNSASYGIQLVAEAFPWRPGDEVIVVEGDFPSDILPWLGLEARSGVKVRMIRPHGDVLEPEELAEAITDATRLFCTTWVHSFTGNAIDLKGIGSVCRERDVVSVINASQGLGALPLDVGGLPIDCLVSIGAKWLLGPYGTGVLWLHPRLHQRLIQVKAYWLNMQDLDALERSEAEIGLPANPGPDTLDIFGTANFFNFLPFKASLEYLHGIGIENVHAHDQSLVDRLIEGLPDAFELLSPRSGPTRSTLVFISHTDRARNAEVAAAMSAGGVDVSVRRGAIRLSPHLYNTPGDIDRALEVLHGSCG